tara:strand:+ start:91 stop:327 length:237 start_codon:yes stop_codon:yes gene_type:complete
LRLKKTERHYTIKKKLKKGDFISYDDKTYDVNGEIWLTREIGVISERVDFTTLKILNPQGKIIILKNIDYKNIKKIGV